MSVCRSIACCVTVSHTVQSRSERRLKRVTTPTASPSTAHHWWITQFCAHNSCRQAFCPVTGHVMHWERHAVGLYGCPRRGGGTQQPPKNNRKQLTIEPMPRGGCCGKYQFSPPICYHTQAEPPLLWLGLGLGGDACVLSCRRLWDQMLARKRETVGGRRGWTEQ